TNPPGRIGAELESLAVFELLDRSNQADVALLNQVEQRHATADVLLRDADDQSKIRLSQIFASTLGATANGLEVLIDRVLSTWLAQPLREDFRVGHRSLVKEAADASFTYLTG